MRVPSQERRRRFVEWERSGRADLVLVVILPMVAIWLLALFVPAGLSVGERLSVAIVFALVWTPLSYIRVRN